HEDCHPFVTVLKLLHEHAIHVPELYATDFTAGFLLLSDFGNRLYLDELNEQSISQLYTPAIHSILKMQGIEQAKNLPLYDNELLMNEMALFKDWFINEHLGVTLTDHQDQVLKTVFKMFAEHATEQPKVLVHRDYHSRNLMITSTQGINDNSPGIIDFQDAVYGPFTYDLASLLKDCYIQWPDSIVKQYSHYFLNLYNQQFDTQISTAQFDRWFDFMAAQRHLKAIGIFCRLNYRDGKSGFLNDIPRTMGYLKTTADIYPELDAFKQLLVDLQPTLPKVS
ncbi:MAG: aminoglycoside phosphotransferase family protein, partial [Marinicella sp.]